MIEIKNLTVSLGYGTNRRVILEDVNLSVQKGECISIVGPSGCGKTSLLRALLNLIEHDKGTIYFDKKLSIAYVQQNPLLLPWRKLIQNATLGLEIRGMIDNGYRDRINGIIDEFGLTKFKDYYPNQLSGGMKQKVELLRALSISPNILLCDEPFASLDFVERFRLNTLFKKNTFESQTTTVLVTHNIEEAIFLGKKIIVLGGTPSKIVRTIEPILNIHPEDAMLCRQSTNFKQYFDVIWNELKSKSQD